MGTMRTIVKKQHAKSALPSEKPDAMLNRAGGVAFDISDPAVKLLTMTGGSFFAEPRYYDGDVCKPKRLANGKLGKLAERLRLASAKAAQFVNCDGLDGVAKEVIATAVDVAKSESPRDILAIANWLRNEGNIRLTPQILLVLASRIDGSKVYVRQYVDKNVKRPDEIKTCLLMHRYFFGMKCLPNALAQGLARRLSQIGEAALMKYDGSDFPTWKDVLCWLPRKKGFPLSEDLSAYFKTGKVSAKTPIARDRSELAKMTEFDSQAQKLARSSSVNWEVLLSQFGKDNDGKQSVWEFLINENLLGYMALMRNLRNLVQAGVSKDALKSVYEKLSNAEEVRRSKQLPFRFLAAYNELEKCGAGSGISKLLEAIENATEIAIENCPKFPGHTVVAIDDSGSMGTNISKKSSMTAFDAACSLGAICARRGDDVDVVAFSDGVRQVNITKHMTMMGIAKKVGSHGGCTNTHLVIQRLIDGKIFPDRLFIFSDMQAWNSSGGLWGGRTDNCADLWAKYRKMGTEAKKTWLHSVNIMGYGDTPFCKTDKRLNLMGGFNEAVLAMALKAEGVDGSDNIPPLSYIRENF
jgi:hypothetical protein